MSLLRPAPAASSKAKTKAIRNETCSACDLETRPPDAPIDGSEMADGRCRCRCGSDPSLLRSSATSAAPGRRLASITAHAQERKSSDRSYPRPGLDDSLVCPAHLVPIAASCQTAFWTSPKTILSCRHRYRDCNVHGRMTTFRARPPCRADAVTSCTVVATTYMDVKRNTRQPCLELRRARCSSKLFLGNVIRSSLWAPRALAAGELHRVPVGVQMAWPGHCRLTSYTCSFTMHSPHGPV